MAGFIFSWDTIAANNATADATINWAEGQLPGTVNDSSRAVMAAIASLNKDLGGTVSTTGSANAYLLTLNCAFTSLATGQRCAFKASFTNSAAATIAVNSLAAKALRKWTYAGDTALASGDIQSGGLYQIIYDAAANAAAGAWIVTNLTAPADGSFNNVVTVGAVFTNLIVNNVMVYGGTTLAASVTGTGSMVLSASPTLTGTLTAATATFSGVVTHSSTTTLTGALTYGTVALSNSVTGTGSMVLSANQTLTGTTTAARLDLPVGSTTLNVGGTGQGANAAMNFRFNSTNSAGIEISTSGSGVAGGLLYILSSTAATVSTWFYSAGQTGITIGGNYTFTSGLQISAGSVSATGLHFGTPGTGIYSAASTVEIDMAISGAVKWALTANGVTQAGWLAANAVSPLTSGGNTAMGLFISNNSSGTFGIYAGVDAPTISAAQGSLYLRSNGSSTSTRAYINTNGSTGWAAITTAS